MAENLLSIFNMAEHGVNTTLDSVHLNDGDLVKAQNAQVDMSGAYGVVRKRDGLAKFTQNALAGEVTGLIGMPLPDLSNVATFFLLPTNDQTAWNGSVSSNNFIKSSTGLASSFAFSTDGAKPAQVVRYGTWGLATYYAWAVTWGNLRQKLYYPGNDYVSFNDQANGGTTPTGFSIHRWDGVNDFLVGRIPDNPNRLDTSGGGIVALVPYSPDELIITVDDGNGATGQGRVFLFSVGSGQLTQLGRESNLIRGVPSVPLIYQGKIWVGSTVNNNTPTDIMWIRPGDTTWTVDTSLTSMPSGRSTINMVQFGGALYVGTTSSHVVGGDQKGIIKKRSTLGVWSDVFTGDGGYDNTTGPIILSRDGLSMLAAYSSDGTAPKCRILASTDGTTWTTDQDMSTLLGGSSSSTTWSIPGYPATDLAGNVYWPWFNSSSEVQIAKRSTLGAWSVIENNNRKARGPISIIQY